MQKSGAQPHLLDSNLALIDGDFTNHLHERGLAKRTIEHIRWAVRHAAWWLAGHRRSLSTLQPAELATFLQRSAPDCWGHWSRGHYRVGINCWLKFANPDYRPNRQHEEANYPWQSWVDEFGQFLEQHRGLARRTRRGYRDGIRAYLTWQFSDAAADWQQVRPQDIWRYAHGFTRGRKAATLNHELRYLRRFFTFVHMRGACSPQLVQAVPRFCNFGQAPRTEVLSDHQRRTLLASFDRSSPTGFRDWCLTLCMVDLGLRPLEVARLSVSGLDLARNALTVPPTKTDRGRQLPLVPRLAVALRTYVQCHRPTADCECLFVRPGRAGSACAMESRGVQRIIARAYRRCAFPPAWYGSYRLRHTFATRLHARGADLKHIADLLGHRHLQTTTIYTKVDLVGLRALALPWPL